MRKITQPLQLCIGPSIRIGRESWCLPYAGFFQGDYDLINYDAVCRTSQATPVLLITLILATNWLYTNP